MPSSLFSWFAAARPARLATLVFIVFLALTLAASPHWTAIVDHAAHLPLDVDRRHLMPGSSLLLFPFFLLPALDARLQP